MNKRPFYNLLLIMFLAGFQAVVFGYHLEPKDYEDFYSNKFSDKQREAMIKYLNETGLSSQAYTKGVITALEHSYINPLIADIARTVSNEIDRTGFSKKLGKGLSDGLIEGLGKNLENSQVIADLTKSINKSVTQMGHDISKNFDKSVGKNSQLGKNAKETVTYYANLVSDAYEFAVLKNMIKTGIGLVAITTALYMIPFIIRTVEREMKRPKLIIESSQLTTIEQLQALFITAEKKEPRREMIFSPSLKKQLDDIVKVTSMINKKMSQGKTNVKYRNLMLYGPPGTGKTMFAKELALQSGLDYAFMSGSSFSKFKDGEGIEALDELFAWAKRTKKGLIIFIDESETFLSKRENMDPQSKAYQLLNNFLNYTGERSNKFMLVFATNHKDALDSAMYRRIDDLIEMPLPSLDQRIATLISYKNKILLDSKNNDRQFINSVHKFLNDDIIRSIARDTKGLSYADLEGIINTIKTDSTIVDPEIITRDLVFTVVERAINKHNAFTNGNYLGFVEN